MAGPLTPDAMEIGQDDGARLMNRRNIPKRIHPDFVEKGIRIAKDRIKAKRKGMDLIEVIGMAVNASQIFGLVTIAAAPDLPDAFLNFAEKFQFILIRFESLDIPSISVSTAEAIFNFMAILVLLIVCWFLIWGVPKGYILERRGHIDCGDETVATVEQVSLNLLPWQKFLKPASPEMQRKSGGCEKMLNDF